MQGDIQDRTPRIESSIQALRQIWERISKNPNRKYTSRYIDVKIKEVDENLREAKYKIEVDGLYEKICARECWQTLQYLSQKIHLGLKSETEVEKIEFSSDESLVDSSGEDTPPIHVEERKSISMASFKDIEGALEKCDGRNKPVKLWFAAFENVATSCELTPVAKYLHCRQLLTGTARLAVESEEDVGNFDKLKAYLILTFEEKTKALDVFRELMATRKFDIFAASQGTKHVPAW